MGAQARRARPYTIPPTGPNVALPQERTGGIRHEPAVTGSARRGRGCGAGTVALHGACALIAPCIGHCSTRGVVFVLDQDDGARTVFKSPLWTAMVQSFDPTIRFGGKFRFRMGKAALLTVLPL